jgi:hypothetical protein
MLRVWKSSPAPGFAQLMRPWPIAAAPRVELARFSGIFRACRALEARVTKM